MPPPQAEYWCFLSYRHADNKEPGRQWATWLHQQIETYEVPADLVGTPNERGIALPERIFPVFRDEEELPADADLASPIFRALDRSKFLVVLCSPRAVASAYVANEILYFKQSGKSDRVLAALLDGEPNASRDAGKTAQGISAEQECFPLPLRHPIDEQGRLVETELAEPVAADFRLAAGRQGWTSPEAYRQALLTEGALARADVAREVDRYRTQCELAKLKILAGILGVPLGTLTQRDKAYQLEKARRRGRIFRRVAVALGVLAVVAVLAGLFAFSKKQDADEQRGLAEERRARAEGLLWEASAASWNEAEVAYEQANPRDAIAHLARGMRSAPNNTGLATFATSLVARPDLPHRTMVFALPVAGVAFAPSGTEIIVVELLYSSMWRCTLWDVESMVRLGTVDVPAGDLDPERLASHPWLAHRPDVMESSFGSGEPLSVASPDGTRLFRTVEDGNRLIDRADPEKARGPFDYLFGESTRLGTFHVASFAPDGLTLLAADHKRTFAHHLPSDRSWALAESGWCTGVAWSPDATYAATSHSHLEEWEVGRGKVLVWNFRHGSGVAFLPRETTIPRELPPDGFQPRQQGAEAFTLHRDDARVTVRRSTDGGIVLELPLGEDRTSPLAATLDARRSRLLTTRGPVRVREEGERDTGTLRFTLYDLEDGRILGTAEAALPTLAASPMSPHVVLHPREDAAVAVVGEWLVAWAGPGETPTVQQPTLFPDTVGWFGDLAFVPDGSALAIGMNRQLILRSWPDLALIAGPAYHESLVNSIAISPDGSLLASASGFTDGAGSRGYATLRELPELNLIGREFSHPNQVTDLLFSPDGRLLITVSDDPDGGEARLWQTSTSLPLTHFLGASRVGGQFFLGRPILRTGPTPDVVTLEVWAEQDACGLGVYAACLPRTSEPIPEWFGGALLPFLSAREVSGDGLLQDVSVTRLAELRRTVQEAVEARVDAATPSVYSRIAAWALAHPADREMAPLCSETLTEHLDAHVLPLYEAGSTREAAFQNRWILGLAHYTDPTRPEVLLGLAEQEQLPKRRAFLVERGVRSLLEPHTGTQEERRRHVERLLAASAQLGRIGAAAARERVVARAAAIEETLESGEDR